MKAIAVTSGGMDSISMGLRLIRDGSEVVFLHIDLKQKAETGERKAVERITKILRARGHKVSCRFVDCSWLGELGGSCLTDEQYKIPEGMDSLEESAGITNWGKPGLWTPGRNIVLLAVAAAVAEVEKADVITWGANQSETAYPDNTMAFAERFEKVIEYGTVMEHKPKVYAPLYHLDKAEIIKWGIDNEFDEVYAYTWSCDDGKEKPCGRCGCCNNRRFAFYIAEKKWGDDYMDNQTYMDNDYFKKVYLPDLKKRCTKNMWMYKYLELIE